MVFILEVATFVLFIILILFFIKLLLEIELLPDYHIIDLKVDCFLQAKHRIDC